MHNSAVDCPNCRLVNPPDAEQCDYHFRALTIEAPLVGEASAKLIRIPLIINFTLVLALLGPGSSHRLYTAGKRAGIADLTVLLFQIWIAGSTVFVT